MKNMAEKIGWGFYFAIYNRIIVKNLKSTRNVLFDLEDQDGTRRLVGIKVRVHVPDRTIAEVEAKRKVRMIMSYISVTFGAYANAFVGVTQGSKTV
jgi:hypothetical protein